MTTTDPRSEYLEFLRTTKPPYDEIDRRVKTLVRELRTFPGVYPYTSCGGHDVVENGCQVERGYWYVDSFIDRSDEGHISLEFLAWIAYDAASLGVLFQAYAKPPYLNSPGRMLFYRMSCTDPYYPPEVFAMLVRDLHEKYYVPAADAANWEEVQ